METSPSRPRRRWIRVAAAAASLSLLATLVGSGVYFHHAQMTELRERLEDAQDAAASEQLPDLGELEDRDDVEVVVDDGGKDVDQDKEEEEDGDEGSSDSSEGDEDSSLARRSSSAPEMNTTTLPLEPFVQIGTPSRRWCGGAPPHILPWRPGSKASSLASTFAKGSTGGGGSGGRRDLAPCLRASPGAVNNCGHKAMAAARRLPSIRTLAKMEMGQFSFGPTVTKARSCAVIGNAGHMVKKPYGAFIDNHDVIIRLNLVSVRFSAGRTSKSGKGNDADGDSNVTVTLNGREYERRRPLEVSRGGFHKVPSAELHVSTQSQQLLKLHHSFLAHELVERHTQSSHSLLPRRPLPLDLERNVGQRTHVRFLNKARAGHVCGGRVQDRLKPVGELRTVISWHPEAMKAKTLASCRNKLGNIPIEWGGHVGEDGEPVTSGTGIALAEIAGDEAKLKAIMKPIYYDLKRMGLRTMKRSFLPQAGLTSGAQAVLMALSVCDHVSVYGLSSFNVVGFTFQIITRNPSQKL